MKLKNKFFGLIAIATALSLTSNVYAADPCFAYWYENDENGNQTYYLDYADKPTYDNSKAISVYGKQNILYINGSAVSDATVIIKNNRSLLPLRSVSEKLGYNVNWNAATREVTISSSASNAVFAIDSYTVNHNDQIINLDVAPEIISGITYVPVRAVANCLGAELNYYTVSPTLAIISVEGDTLDEKYSVSNAQTILTEQVKNALAQIEQTGKANGWTINYTGTSVQGNYLIDVYSTENLGRYYIFNVYTQINEDEFSDDLCNLILFDKTTGETYSLTAGSSNLGYNVSNGIDAAVSNRVISG